MCCVCQEDPEGVAPLVWPPTSNNRLQTIIEDLFFNNVFQVPST